jgi:hypothetical protein
MTQIFGSRCQSCEASCGAAVGTISAAPISSPTALIRNGEYRRMSGAIATE